MFLKKRRAKCILLYSYGNTFNIYREQNILPPDREKKEMERFMIPKRDSKDQRENNLNEAIIKQQMLSTF